MRCAPRDPAFIRVAVDYRAVRARLPRHNANARRLAGSVILEAGYSGITNSARTESPPLSLQL